MRKINTENLNTYTVPPELNFKYPREELTLAAGGFLHPLQTLLTINIKYIAVDQTFHALDSEAFHLSDEILGVCLQGTF
jgi:hypothetical protein